MVGNGPSGLSLDLGLAGMIGEQGRRVSSGGHETTNSLLKWTPVFGPAGAIAKVDRSGSGAAVVDLPRSAVVQRLMRAFVAIEFEVIDQSFMTIGS